MATKDASPSLGHLQQKALFQSVLRIVTSLAVFTDASAAVFSVISGLNVISEKTARKSGSNAKPITLQELFYHPRSHVTDQILYIPDSEYDPDYDYDFTSYKGDAAKCTRGGYPYKRPAGWKRKAVRVVGKYEDDVWLGVKGWRDGSSEGEWAVSYHGTGRGNVPSIVVDGYDAGKRKRQKYGDGIYSAPDAKVAEAYAQEFLYNGQKYKCILQNRVNPNGTYSISSNLGDGIYYVTPNQQHIRPYGVCIKKI